MGLLPFGNDDDEADDSDTTPAMADDEREALAEVRGDVGRVLQLLESHNFSVEDRQQVAERAEQVFEVCERVTKFRISYVLPHERPTNKQIREPLEDLHKGLLPDYTKDYTRDELLRLKEKVIGLREQIKALNQFDYEFEEREVKSKHGRKVQSLGRRTDVPDDLIERENVDEEELEEVYAGPHARKAIDIIGEAESNRAVFLGTGTRNGRDASIDIGDFKRHVGVLGTTGSGKSTLLVNMQRQVALDGAGMCVMDPKGDDSLDLVQRLPEDRLDDVVWVEPDGGGKDHISGFNYVSIGLDPDDDRYDAAAMAAAKDFKRLLGAGDYWGPRMDRVTQNIFMAMNEYNKRFPGKKDFNFVDFYYILASPASRREFAARIKSAGILFLDEYLEKIEEMGDDELEPLLGRFEEFIDNRITRRLLGFREAEVNMREIVEEQKIMILRMSQLDKDTKRMIGMGTLRRIWATIRSRSNQEGFARDTFYVFADEFDNIAQQGSEVPTIFSEARSLGLSLIVATQYLKLLPETVIDAIRNNANTLMAFKTPDPKQAGKIADRMDLETSTITNTAKYHIWMRITEKNGELSRPFRVYTHPLYPPVRDLKERNRIIMRSLKEHGKPEPTDQEEMDNLLYSGGDGAYESPYASEYLEALKMGDEDYALGMLEAIYGAYENGVLRGQMNPRAQDEGGDDDGAEASQQAGETAAEPADTGMKAGGNPTAGANTNEESVDALLRQEKDTLLEGIYAACLHRGIEQSRESEGPVEIAPAATAPISRVEGEVKVRIGDSGYLSVLTNALEQLPEELVVRERQDGELHLGLTAKGRSRVFQQDTGSAASGGGADHRYILRQSFKWFTALGYETWLPTQEGDEVADGMANVPIDPAEGESLEEIEELKAELQERYPKVWELARAQDLAIEAETSTLTHPEQTLKNFRGAMEDGRHTVFVVKDGRGEDTGAASFTYWGERAEYAFYEQVNVEGQRRPGVNHDRLLFAKAEKNGNRHFYSDSHKLQPEDGLYPLRELPAGVKSADDLPRHRWRETDDGGVVCEDTDGNHIATFDELGDVQDPEAVKEAFPAYYTYNHSDGEYVVRTREGDKKVFEEKGVLKRNFGTVPAPMIPENRFAERPDEDDFTVLIIPDDDNPEYDQPHVYERGELKPLFPKAVAGDAPSLEDVADGGEPDMPADEMLGDDGDDDGANPATDPQAAADTAINRMDAGRDDVEIVGQDGAPAPDGGAAVETQADDTGEQTGPADQDRPDGGGDNPGNAAEREDATDTEDGPTKATKSSDTGSESTSNETAGQSVETETEPEPQSDEVQELLRTCRNGDGQLVYEDLVGRADEQTQARVLRAVDRLTEADGMVYISALDELKPASEFYDPEALEDGSNGSASGADGGVSDGATTEQDDTQQDTQPATQVEDSTDGSDTHAEGEETDPASVSEPEAQSDDPNPDGDTGTEDAGSNATTDNGTDPAAEDGSAHDRATTTDQPAQQPASAAPEPGDEAADRKTELDDYRDDDDLVVIDWLPEATRQSWLRLVKKVEPYYKQEPGALPTRTQALTVGGAFDTDQSSSGDDTSTDGDSDTPESPSDTDENPASEQADTTDSRGSDYSKVTGESEGADSPSAMNYSAFGQSGESDESDGRSE